LPGHGSSLIEGENIGAIGRSGAREHVLIDGLDGIAAFIDVPYRREQRYRNAGAYYVATTRRTLQ
jgi:hypothetical protein